MTAEPRTVQVAGRPARDSALQAAQAARPSMPRVTERFCEGESCDVGDYAALACAPVGLRAAASDTAPVVARVERGDTVYLLYYTQLGGWVWWHRGREEHGGEFWAGPEDGALGAAIVSDDSSVAVGRSHPVRADWWQVVPRSGPSGWWRADTLHSLMSIPMMHKWNDQCPTR